MMLPSVAKFWFTFGNMGDYLNLAIRMNNGLYREVVTLKPSKKYL